MAFIWIQAEMVASFRLIIINYTDYFNSPDDGHKYLLSALMKYIQFWFLPILLSINVRNAEIGP